MPSSVQKRRTFRDVGAEPYFFKLTGVFTKSQMKAIRGLAKKRKITVGSLVREAVVCYLDTIGAEEE